MSRYEGAGLADVVLVGIEDRLRELNTAEPGQIVDFDSATQTATVRPMLQRAVLDDDGEYQLETPPDIYDVPVIFPRSRLGYLTFPISQGDSGLIVYGMRDIGQWRYTGVQGSPGDHRVCSMAGAMFLPGLYPDADKLPATNGSHVVLAPLSGAYVLLGSSSATEFLAIASKVETQLGKLVDAIANAAVGTSDGGAAFKANVLSNLASYGFNAAGSTAATKVKGF